MTIEDYRNRRIAEKSSMVDGSVNEQNCILNTRVNTNPSDIQSWIGLIRLQVHTFFQQHHWDQLLRV